MPRIQPNTEPDHKSKELLAGVEKMLGGIPNLFTTMAHSSAALGVFVGALGALAISKLKASLREQIALTVAGANGCDYCASAHTALGKMSGVSEEELMKNLYTQSNDEKTQAALSFARKIVETRGHVSDADLKAVRQAGYNEGEIVDIIAVTCINIFTNYFNHIAETTIDFPVVSTASTKKSA